ncbi:uncharacterized protein [Diadema antillarum]|uniref:uncharacterized protein n=1 Tax=Diadema antillarum TaxID=105358 RepID=UPI003A845B9D
METAPKPTREWKGWVRNRKTHELEWCIITAGLMGVFRDPEADSASLVLTLTDFAVKPLWELVQRASRKFPYLDDYYSVKFESRKDPSVFYTYGTETEEDFKTWYRTLTGEEPRLPTEPTGRASPLTPPPPTGCEQDAHGSARRTDSGLGDDIGTERILSGSRDGRGSGAGGYKSSFGSIEESESNGDSLKNGKVDIRITLPPINVQSNSSDSLSDSGQSQGTTPESEHGDEVPRLRPNAHLLRRSRANESRLSAPLLGDLPSDLSREFSFWEEDGMLTKTYSLPMRSPSRKRIASEGDDLDVFSFAFDRNVGGSEEAISPTSHTPPNRRTVPQTSYSDPARKTIGSRMTVKASKFVGRVAHFRSQRTKSPIARSDIVCITIEGDLLRKHKTKLLPCFCVLSGTILYSYKSKDLDDVSELTIDITRYKLSKLTAATSESKELDCAFVLTSQTGPKEFVFIAKSLDQAREWYGHLEDILKNFISQERPITRGSVPDLRGSEPMLNQYPKTKAKARGGTFKRLVKADDEKRGSFAARMSRGSFEDAYGYVEETSRQRKSSHEDAVDDGKIGEAVYADDNEQGEEFIQISMDDVMRSQKDMAARSLSRSLDDIGASTGTRKTLLGGRTTPPSKTKRHKRTVPVPASEVFSPVRSGYLDVKKSGSWRRYWTVLTEERLYLYRKPTDSQTVDMIALEGYGVLTGSARSATSGKTSGKFGFELQHPRIISTQFLCESLEERIAWMAAITESCKKASRNGTSDLNSSKIQFQIIITSLEPLKFNVGEPLMTSQSQSSSDVSDASPIMERRKQIIADKYERVEEAEAMEMLRVNTILNQRRMSADVKINAVERKLLQQRKQRKRRKGVADQKDEEEAILEEQLEQLRARLEDVKKESQERSLKQEERLQSIKKKKEVELKILEQERKLQKHRKAAQQALQQIVKGISSITPPIGGSKPRFDLISEEAEDEEEERKLSLVSSVGSDSLGSLCSDTRKVSAADSTSTSESTQPMGEIPATVKLSAEDSTAPLPRALHAPKLSRSTAGSSTDSSSSLDSPVVGRHDFSKGLSLTETDSMLDPETRDKSKSFDSGIADEVDINSNKSLTLTTNGYANVEGELSSPDGNHNTMVSVETGQRLKAIRTEVSEDVLRDIELFERIAQRALEQASWDV